LDPGEHFHDPKRNVVLNADFLKLGLQRIMVAQ